MKRLLLLLLLGICCSYSIGYAQPYPVTTGIVVTSHAAYLDQYAQPNNTIVTLLSTDSRAVYNARLNIIVSGEGFTLKTKPTYQPGPTYLYKDQPLVLTGLSLAPYFDINNLDMEGLSYSDLLNSGGRLPDGPISICVEVSDYYRQNEPPVSNTACNYGTVQAFLPPIIINPIGTQELTNPQNLLLSWQSQHFGAFPVQYTVEIYRDNLGFSPDVTIASSAPLFTTVTPLQTYNYTAADPFLTAGEDYLIRVRVEDLMGATAFENEGWSEIKAFTLTGSTAMVATLVDCYEINETLCIGHCSMTYSSLIMSDGTTYEANINFSGAASGLEAWLNGLNVGDFTVTETIYPTNPYGNCQVDLVISGLISVNQAVKPQDFKISSDFNNSCTTGQPDPAPYITNTYKFSLCGQSDPDCLPPSNANISSLTANSMVVDWNIPGGATIDFFSVSVAQEGASDPLLYPVDAASSELTVDNLQPNTNYTISVCTHCTDGSDPQCVTLDPVNTPGDQPSVQCFTLEQSFCIGDCAAFYTQFHTTASSYTINQGFWGSSSQLENALNNLGIGTYTVVEEKTPNNQWGYCGLDLTITAEIPANQSELPLSLSIDAKFGESCTTGVQDNVSSTVETFNFVTCEGGPPTPSCAPPINPSVANVTTRQIELNWGIPSGENVTVTGFEVRHRLANSGSDYTTTTLGATIQNHTITGLNGLESYEIEICTLCEGDLLECANLGTVTTDPFANCPAPTGLSQNGVTASTIQIQWDYADDLDLPNIIDYEVRYREEGSTASFDAVSVSNTTTSYTISGLQDQQAYEVEVCTNCTENGPACSSLGVITTGDPPECEVPKFLSLTEATINSLTVSWANDNVLNVGHIVVGLRETGSPIVLVSQSIAGTATSYTFTGLSPDQSYDIVVCFNCENEAEACSYLTASTLPLDDVACPPIINVALVEATSTTVTLSWTPPEDLNSTLITYRKIGEANYGPVIGYGPNQWTFEGLEENTEYEFKLYYFCEGEEIVTLFNARTEPPCPAVDDETLVVTEVGDYYAWLNWELVAEAEAYEIRYRELDVGAWILIEVDLDLENPFPYYIGGDLTPGLTYEAQVRAICADDVSSQWTESVLWSTNCSKPTIAWVSDYDSRSAIFQWYLMPFSNYYELEYREKGKPDWIIASSSEERVSVDGLLPETTYEYRLRMKCNSGAWSEYSDIYEFTTLKDCDPPSGSTLVALITTNSALVKMTFSAQAENYQLRYREIGTEVWQTIVSTSYNQTLTDLYPSTTYELMVSYDCGGNWSDWGAAAQFTTLCQAPGVLTIEDITPFSAELIAGSVKAALGIEFSYRQLGDNVWITVPTTASTSATLSGLSDLTTYEVRARTQCGGTGWSSFSDTYLFTTLVDCQAPSAITEVARTTSSISISWDAHPRATKWKVFIQDAFTATSVKFPPADGLPIPGDGGDGWSFVTVTEPSYTFNDLVDSNPYRFKVQSWCDGFGWTDDSPEITLRTRPICRPIISSWVTDVTDNNAMVHWSAQPHNDEWHLEFRIANSNDWWAVYAGITNTQTILWSLQPGLTYEYRIKSRCDDFGWTDFSSTFYFTTEECLEPTDIVEEPLSSSSIMLSWTPSEGSNTYLVEYRLKETDGAAWTTATTSESFIELTGLQAGKLYEYRIGEDCMGGTVLYSPMDEFMLERESLDNEFYECGTPLEPLDLSNFASIPALFPDDIIIAGDFQVTIIEATKVGNRFAGTGYIAIPYFNQIQVNVKFKDILVNDEYVMMSGYMKVTGIGIELIDRDFAEQLDGIVDVLNNINDWLLEAQEVLEQLEDLIATIKPMLPDDIVQQLEDAKEALENAQTQEELDAAKILFEEAKEAFKEALEEFLDELYLIIREALEALESEYSPEVSNASTEYNNSKNQFDEYLDGIFSGTGSSGIFFDDYSNVELFLLEEVEDLVEFESENPGLSTFISNSEEYFTKSKDYFVADLLSRLNGEFLTEEQLQSFTNIMEEEGFVLLLEVGPGIKDQTPHAELVELAKEKIIEGILDLAVKAMIE